MSGSLRYCNCTLERSMEVGRNTTGRETKLVLQRRFGHAGYERKKGKLWDQEYFENCMFRIFFPFPTSFS